MKLVEAKDGLFVFHLSRRERAMLTHVLRLFPVGSGPVAPLSISSEVGALAEHEQALGEALAEQRVEHKRLVDAFLGEDGRFAADKQGYRLRLPGTQLDWLLRVLNEVRVGLWIKLGRPKDLGVVALSGEIEAIVAMELCSFFQMRFLAALEVKELVPRRRPVKKKRKVGGDDSAPQGQKAS